MTANNKLEKRIEFIVEQQAQFSVSIQQLQGAHANADKRMTRLENIMVRFYEDSSTKLNALINAQMRTDQRLSETNDRLNVLIDVVETFVSDGRTSTGKKSTKRPKGRNPLNSDSAQVT